MKFSVVASFTLRPPERVYDFTYRCQLEAASSAGGFELSVHRMTSSTGTVMSKTLRCAPNELRDELRREVRALHPDRELALGSFEPAKVWLQVSA